MLLDKKDVSFIEGKLKKSRISIDMIKKGAILSKKVLLICGPTCSGKSKLALNLASILETDIISVDSMQVYRGMDIGTDKYDTARYGIKQYMTDVIEPDHRITAVEFRNKCRELIRKEFFNRGKIPVLAGGSGLYIRAVIDDLDFVFEENDSNNLILREKIKKEFEEKGSEYYFNKLKTIDPDYSKKINKNDARRIIRAMEVYCITGLPFSSFQKNWTNRKPVYNCTIIGLKKDKTNIEKCIEDRVNNMFSKGIIKEVKRLIEKGYGECNSLRQAVGYKEIINYYRSGKKQEIDEVKETIIRNTKKLVKKQNTWFKADPRVYWISVDNYDNILNLMVEVLKKFWGDL